MSMTGQLTGRCPACGGMIVFGAEANGQESPCPLCAADITLEPLPPNLLQRAPGIFWRNVLALARWFWNWPGRNLALVLMLVGIFLGITVHAVHAAYAIGYRESAARVIIYLFAGAIGIGAPLAAIIAITIGRLWPATASLLLILAGCWLAGNGLFALSQVKSYTPDVAVQYAQTETIGGLLVLALGFILHAILRLEKIAKP